jgi:anti-anti-sigma regulatory factor
MQINSSIIQGAVPITILCPFGALDASNYQELISKAHEAYDAGSRFMIVDLSEIPYMSSSGIVALHTIALLLLEDLPESRTAWDTRSPERDSNLKRRLKLVNPPPRVNQLLEMAGFKRFIEVYGNLDSAIAAFEGA